jgi:MFS family permease
MSNPLSLTATARTDRRRHEAISGRHITVVALVFLLVVAFSTAPSPLYPAYQLRDGFSTLTVTLVYAANSAGVLGGLIFVGHMSDTQGRRRMVLSGAAISAISALLLCLTAALPVLFTARILGGVAVGTVTSAATVWLGELQTRARPNASPRRIQLLATSVNVLACGVGPLLSGVLASYAPDPLRLTFVVLLACLCAGIALLLASPETRQPQQPRPRYRPQKISVPRAARRAYFSALFGTFFGLASLGLYVGLAGTFLTHTLGHHSPALSGTVVFLVFFSGVTAQVLTSVWSPLRRLTAGLVISVCGLVLVVVTVWLPHPSLIVFLAGGVVTGVGTGTILIGGVTTAAALAPAESRAESIAGLYVAVYAGLSLPVVGLGVALQHADTAPTLLIFTLLVATGVACTLPALLRTRPPAPNR